MVDIDEIGKVLPWVHVAIANAKTRLANIYHGIKPEFLQGYLNEFCYKFNRRYGGTYAHKDIAFELGSAISVPFKLYLIEEFQRLKTEVHKLLGWSAKRELSKINYRIHTDAA